MNRKGSSRDSDVRDRIARHAHVLFAHLTATTRPDKPPFFQFEEGQVALFVEYMLENPEFHCDLRALSDAISTALVPSIWPSPGLPALREAAGGAARNGVCRKVWKEEELAYKCKTCERDPSCVICVPCFRNGNHQGHDYAMLRVNGGCCDCGDDQAWNPGGFCSNHQGASPESEDLSFAMPPNLRLALKESVTAAAESVYKMCAVLHRAFRSKLHLAVPEHVLVEARHTRLIARTVSSLRWLNEVVSCGDGIRRMVGSILTSIQLPSSSVEAATATAQHQSSFPSWLEVMLSMDGSGMLPDQILSTLHTLYFDLITDVVFRRVFLDKFAKNYPRFIHAQLLRRYKESEFKEENSDDSSDGLCDIIGNFTVQLFTVPALVPVMIQEDGLLETLLRLLCILLESASMPIGLYRDDIPFQQTNFVQRRLMYQNEAVEVTLDKDSDNNNGPVPVKGKREVVSILDSLFQEVKHTDLSHENRSEHVKHRIEEIQAIYHGVRERSHLLSNIESADVTQDVNDASEDNDSEYDQYALLYMHQIAAFEAGILELCPSIQCVASALPGAQHNLHPNTGFITAINRARQSQKAALRGEAILAHTMRIDLYSDRALTVGDVLARIMADLNYILSHREVAFHVVHERMDLFRLFVRVFSLSQGMHPLSRRMGDHLLTEPNLWFEGFRVEIDSYHLAQLLVRGFREKCNNAKNFSNLKGKSIDLKSSRLRAIGVLRKCLDEWLAREEHLEALSTYAGEYFTVAHAISIHLPLHRIYALFVHYAMAVDELDLLTALSGDMESVKSEHVARIMIHPLRIQAFLAQERAKMWRRNGRNANFMSAYYRYPVYSDWYADLDIFLIQCCAAIMKTDEVISIAMKTFRIKDIGNLMDFIISFEQKSDATVGDSDRIVRDDSSLMQNIAEKQDEDSEMVDTGILPLVPISFKEDISDGSMYVRAPSDPREDIVMFAPILLEGLMTFFVHITLERTLCGQSEGQNLRRKLLHLLCSQDRTHSQLCRACSLRYSHTENSTRSSQHLVDQAISSIANYVKPKKMEHGRYTLKDSMWKEFDPFFPQYTVREKNAAEVRYATAMKRKTDQMMLITNEVINDRPLWNQFEGLKKLCLSLCGRDKLSLGTVILRETFRVGRLQRIQTVTCAAALQLLCANVESISSTHSTCEAKVWLSSCCQPETFEKSPLGIMLHLVRHETDFLSSRHSDFMPVFSRIIRASYHRCSSPDQHFLQTQIPESLRFLFIDHSEAGNVKHMLTPDEERRQKLLAKRKERQAVAMRQMREAQANFAKLISESDVSKPSTNVKADGDEDLNRDDVFQSARASSAGHSKAREGNVVRSKSTQKCAKKKLRQAVIIRKMKEAQANFAKFISESDVSKPSTNVKADGDEDLNQDDAFQSARASSAGHSKAQEGNVVCSKSTQKCALCHEADVSDESGPLGYIGFRQRTRLPSISKDQNKIHSQSMPSSNTSEISDSGVRERELKSKHTSTDMTFAGDFTKIDEKLVHLGVLREGVESSRCSHISLCSHVIHLACFERYFSSLLHSQSGRMLFEGYNVVNLQRIEFLCPVCRRLANLVLPCVRFPEDGGSCDRSASKTSNATLPGEDEDFSIWLEKSRLRIENTDSMFQFHFYGALGNLKWDFHEGVFQASLPFKTSTIKATDPLSADAILGILLRFRVSVEAYDTFVSDADGKECCMTTTCLGLPVAIISTIACAEILVRSYTWDSSPLQATRRTVPKLFACARAQLYLSTKHQVGEWGSAVQGLWSLLTCDEHVVADPFVALSYLFLMWPTSLTTENVSFLIRLGVDYAVRQSRTAGSSSIFSKDFVVFLRRVSILRWCVMPWTKLPISACADNASALESTRQEIESIAHYLNVNNLRTLWAKEMSLTSRLSSGDDAILPKLCTPDPTKLKRLPSLFQTLLEGLNGVCCNNSLRATKNGALCLVCGKVISAPSDGNVIEISMHADLCGAGIGVFLLLKEAKIFILRGDRSVFWGSPYLDVHGEEDEMLRRGTPLLLNTERYSVLEKLWLCHGFDQDPRILGKTQRLLLPRYVGRGLGPAAPTTALTAFRPVR